MMRQIAPFAADLWQQRELLWQFTLRNVELRHRGSHLGLIWSVLNPLLMLGLYVLVLGYIFGGSFGIVPGETKVDYGLGVFLGLTLFNLFTEVLTTAPMLIVANPNFVKKVVFPLEIIPAAGVGAAGFHSLIGLGLVLTGVVCLGPGLHWSVLWLPVILLPLVLLSLGIGWSVSALGVFMRDIGQVTGFLATALMWASGVFFSARHYSAAWPYLRLNPILLAIDLARDVVLWSRPVNWSHLAYLYATGLFACYIGHQTFRRLKPSFADVI